MGDDPSADRKPEPNLELPRLRLPSFRRQKIRRAGPSTQPPAAEPIAPKTVEPEQPEPHAAEPAAAHRDPSSRRPALPGPMGAVLAGLVVGAAGAAGTYGGLRSCEAINGTPSCGASGLGYLVAIAVGMVAIGWLLLRLLGIEDPLSTSFLGVGIVVVVVLAGLTGVIFSAWMFLVIPLLAAAAYTLAHWVATRFVEPVQTSPGPDVR